MGVCQTQEYQPYLEVVLQNNESLLLVTVFLLRVLSFERKDYRYKVMKFPTC